jgi:hypothetical protein
MEPYRRGPIVLESASGWPSALRAHQWVPKGMTSEAADPNEPISDGDAPTGDPDLAPHEQPDPATKSGDSSDQGSTEDLEEHLDADEGDPSLDSYPG